MSAAPRVGDKVVYAPDPKLAHLPLHPEWRHRAEEPAVVVVEASRDVDCWCWSLSERDWWCAPPERLRVVERATYELRGITPADLDQWADQLQAAADAHPHPANRDLMLEIADQLRSGPYRTWEAVEVPDA
jgi:hypothetical protein